MKKLIIALALTAPALGLIGCQDNTKLENQIAAMRAEIRDMKAQSAEKSDSSEEQPISNNADINGLEIRIGNRFDKMNNDLNGRIDGLQSQPVVGDTASSKSSLTDANFKVFKVFYDAEQKREKEEADAQRKAAAEQAKIDRDERLANAAKLAEENGLEFDPDNPGESIRKIMMDPEKRAKAFEVMRNERTKRRLANLNLTEQQTEDVLRIEKDNRTKVSDTISSARERGATPEQIEADLKYIQEDKDRELEGRLDETQLEEYKKSEGSGMMGGLEGISRMIPPGMIPGMGGEDQ
ncbi:MAG: hypothetical protein L3J82_01100 [Planctomycetes bacterium]|nr:hypothetical protein [Planctomycetota bacterium]